MSYIMSAHRQHLTNRRSLFLSECSLGVVRSKMAGGVCFHPPIDQQGTPLCTWRVGIGKNMPEMDQRNNLCFVLSSGRGKNSEFSQDIEVTDRSSCGSLARQRFRRKRSSKMSNQVIYREAPRLFCSIPFHHGIFHDTTCGVESVEQEFAFPLTLIENTEAYGMLTVAMTVGDISPFQSLSVHRMMINPSSLCPDNGEILQSSKSSENVGNESLQRVIHELDLLNEQYSRRLSSSIESSLNSSVQSRFQRSKRRIRHSSVRSPSKSITDQQRKGDSWWIGFTSSSSPSNAEENESSSSPSHLSRSLDSLGLDDSTADLSIKKHTLQKSFVSLERHSSPFSSVGSSSLYDSPEFTGDNNSFHESCMSSIADSDLSLSNSSEKYVEILSMYRKSSVFCFVRLFSSSVFPSLYREMRKGRRNWKR